MKRKNVIAFTVTAVLILLMFGFLLYLEEDIAGLLERTAPYSHIVFFAIQLLSVILAPIPSNFTATAGAMFFGPMMSFLITYIAVTMGSVMVFLFVRHFMKKMNTEKMEKKIGDRRYLKLLYEKPTAFLSVAFLLPVFPDDVICYLAGLTKVKTWVFILLVVLCRPWGLLVASGMGSFNMDMDEGKLIAFAAIALVVLLLYIIYRTFLHERVVEYMMKRRKREE